MTNKKNKEMPDPTTLPPNLFEEHGIYAEEGFTEEEILNERLVSYTESELAYKRENKGVKLPEKQRLEAKRDKLIEEISKKTLELEKINARLDQINQSEKPDEE